MSEEKKITQEPSKEGNEDSPDSKVASAGTKKEPNKTDPIRQITKIVLIICFVLFI